MQLRIELQHNSESENFYVRLIPFAMNNFYVSKHLLAFWNWQIINTIVIDGTGF